MNDVLNSPKTRNLPVIDVLKILIGKLQPTGNEETDYEVLENIKTLCNVHDYIFNTIERISAGLKNDERESARMCYNEVKKYIDHFKRNVDFSIDD